MMKLRYHSLFVLLCACLTGTLSAAFPVAGNGLQPATIVVAADAPLPIKHASEELVLWVEKLTGTKLKTSAEAVSGRNIYLSNSEDILQKYPEDAVAMKDNDGYAVRQDGDSLYLFAVSPKGVLNGVFRLLMRNTDIIWPRPEKECALFTPLKKLVLSDVNYCDLPDFLVRGWQFNGTSDVELLWCTRNACNWTDRSISKELETNNREWGFAVEAFGGHNIVISYMPDRVHYKAHPEFYAWDGTKRLQPSKRDSWCAQLCYSNLAIIPEFIKSVDKIFPTRDNAICYGIRQQDGQEGWCLCEKCMAPITLADGSLLTKDAPNFRSTQFFMFLTPILEHIKQKWPDRLVQTYAYGVTNPVPACNVPDNLEIQYAPIHKDMRHPIESEANHLTKESLEGWSKKVKNIFVYEYYGLGSEFPRPYDINTLKDFQTYYAAGARRIHSEISKGDPDNKWIGGGIDIWDGNMMYYWVETQGYWDIHADALKLRDEFLRRTFGEAAPLMKEYYANFEKIWNELDDECVWNTKSQKYWHLFYKRGMLKKSLKLLDKAQSKKLTPARAAMLARVRNHLLSNSYLKLDIAKDTLMSKFKKHPENFENLVKNPGFETPSEDFAKNAQNPFGWTGSGIAEWGFWQAQKEEPGTHGPVKGQGRNNSTAAHMNIPTSNACYITSLPALTGQAYFVRIRVRKEIASDTCGLLVQWQNASGWNWNNQFEFEFSKNADKEGWLTAEGLAIVPENVTKLVMTCGIEKGNKGTVYLDDAEIYLLGNVND